MPLSDLALIELLRSRAYAGKTVRLTPETQLRLAAALYAAIGRDRTPAKQHAHAVALGFLVEQVSEDGERIGELIAASAHVDIGRAAYEEAVRRYPKGRRLRYRHGAQLVPDSMLAKQRTGQPASPGESAHDQGVISVPPKSE